MMMMMMIMMTIFKSRLKMRLVRPRKIKEKLCRRTNILDKFKKV